MQNTCKLVHYSWPSLSVDELGELFTSLDQALSIQQCTPSVFRLLIFILILILILILPLTFSYHLTDMDECHSKDAKCDVNSECINTLGSYECKCLPGYIGNGSECKRKCSKQLTCLNTVILY